MLLLYSRTKLIANGLLTYIYKVSQIVLMLKFGFWGNVSIAQTGRSYWDLLAFAKLFNSTNFCLLEMYCNLNSASELFRILLIEPFAYGLLIINCNEDAIHQDFLEIMKFSHHNFFEEMHPGVKTLWWIDNTFNVLNNTTFSYPYLKR